MAGPDYVLATLSEARILNQPLLSAAESFFGNEEEGREAIYACVAAINDSDSSQLEAIRLVPRFANGSRAVL